jgi:hypothetical protein
MNFTTLESDGDMIVQSGIKWEDVNQTLAERGIPLFFPVCLSILLHYLLTNIARSRTWCHYWWYDSHGLLRQ